MHLRRVLSASLFFLVVLVAQALHAQEGSLVLANENGVAIEFAPAGTGWRWTRLITPATPEGWNLGEAEMLFSAGDGTDMVSPTWELMAQASGRLVFEQSIPLSGVRLRRVFSFGPASNVVRVETLARSLDQPKLLHRAGLVTLRVEGESFATTGASPASFPVFGASLFGGVEDVCAESRAEGDTMRFYQTPDLSVGDDWQFIAAFVLGWQVPRAAPFLPGESRTREAFLHYLDAIRVQPADINLHSDTWWTLPLPFSEADVLHDIETLRKDFFERTGLFFNTYALDLGWSDPHTLWGIDEQNFPHGFSVIQEKLAEMGCHPGLWVSPGSAYPPGLDNQWLDQQGYETTTIDDEGDKVACFALGGRYQREFTETVVHYVQQYSLGHVIFDGLMPTCDNPDHQHLAGAASIYSIDGGFKDVMDRVRQANPGIIIEPLSCGHPPSPWWNMHTPFLLGPAGDDVPYGRVPCPDWTESLISARDIAYRASQESWLVRTQALETFDIIMQSPGVFQNLAVMAAGRGRWFMSANIRPELMQPEDWDFFAALVRWQRANKRDLVDARMIGGNPARRETYGYMFHSADRDLYCVRNPWIEPRTIRLPARVSENRDVKTIYPRRNRIAQLTPDADGVEIVVAPYETLFLETSVAGDDAGPVAPAEVAPAELEAGAPEIRSVARNEQREFTYHWTGSVTVPDVDNVELCVLVEGPASVATAQGSIRLNGRNARLTRNESAGQFGAAADASPENWIWLRTPIARGTRTFDLSLKVPFEGASVGVYLRGTIAASNDDAPDDPTPFPVYRPLQQSWSHTLQPLMPLQEDPDEQ